MASGAKNRQRCNREKLGNSGAGSGINGGSLAMA
jgi:hypothetical protein